ncbi:hypothetical protein Psta_2886 [Pirellula staleyi DSM 6068]|uniref:Uncharacterized protein n=1 Tax=Pirellula staleyi (strain ATCC 27377 / DSM 6068 / ICPB 4128) TaxID=530564 RepID=D2R8L0_PIRSD|nr:hypothetical protein [Pirellula staleyi]ADB17551.1 hypothetical protein Psta_2886 [Pirellula staleyi DSM 6068]
MPIDVTCGKCLTRFQVSEKFAGRSGPCPKCKTVIKVPELKEEVKVHAPEPSGPKDSKGELVLNPILRKESKLSPLLIGAIAGGILLTLIAAVALRISAPKPGQVSQLMIGIGAVLLAPPLAAAGYAILRDDELEPHRGTALLVRLIAPSIVYPLLWGVYWYIFWQIKLPPPPPFTAIAIVVPLVIGVGALTANASLDLEFGTGAFHYAVYLAATIVLRMLMGMHAFWQIYT